MDPDPLRAGPQAAERYLHEHIPISAAMGIRVVHVGLDAVELAAELSPNVNHRSTVFGGSSISVAILAAWTLAQLHVLELPSAHRVVIRQSQMEYLAPISGSFAARCESPGAPVWDRFLRLLERRGRAQVELAASLVSDGLAVGSFRGTYAAVRA